MTAGPANAVLAIAGPTASGKSALALRLAAALEGTVINADALQVYRELRILTARPTPAEEAAVPHRLYGTQPAAAPCSAGQWRRQALAAIAETCAAGRRPILCGGTGLYLKALEEGLAPTPPVPAEVKAEAAALLAAVGAKGLRARLARQDLAAAERISESDPQRLLRAWSVWRATGRTLSDWQHEAGEPGLPLRWLVLLPPREALRDAVERRWRAMLAAGALEEVRNLLALGLDPALPAMKAVGVRELAAVLAGRATLAQASSAAITATRQYLKRQTTWLRTQVLASHARAEVAHAKFSDLEIDKMVNKLRQRT
jgi:tRNA dimethylallyltransferase